MFDKVHVEEKWFDKTFESSKILLAKGQEPPNRKTHHKSNIPKIMFLCAQAQPHFDAHQKHSWDGTITLILIGHWVKAKRNSRYYKKGDKKWKNRNVSRKKNSNISMPEHSRILTD
jgi:hypothetical protein